MRKAPKVFPFLCLLTLPLTVVAAGRESPNLINVQTATFIGDRGTEWFTAGAFTGNDTILVAGVTLSPDITLRGVKANVIGKDGPVLPEPTEYVRLGEKETGRVIVPDVSTIGKDKNNDVIGDLDAPPTKEELDKRAKDAAAKLSSVPGRFTFNTMTTIESKDVYARLYGGEKSATGFIARFDGSLKQVQTLSRLPRGAGTISSIAIGSKGEVYVSGAATERLADAGGDRRLDAPESVPASDNYFPFRHVYIARLSPDFSKFEWVREIKAASFAPELRALKDGNVSMIGPSYIVYSPEGKLVQASFMDKSRVASGSAACPVTGRYTRVGDWMSATGREPYRCPRLTIYDPDGKVHKYLQGWRGPFFAPHHFHLVADSAVRRSAYDNDGNLYYSTWSHGGNNCMGRLPYDAERTIPDGLGYAGSSTYCFVVKLDPEHNVKAGTLWTSAGSIMTLAAAVDGSVAWTGNSNDTPNLPNTLSRTGANQIAVVEPNMSSYRFYSGLPAVGTRVVVGGCVDRLKDFAFATGTVGGKPMLLCLSGAVAEEPLPEGKKETPPLRNPVQESFAGGLSDGYALLMDLTPKQPLAFDPPERETAPRDRKPYSGPPLLWPAEGQEWLIGTEKCVTVKVTFRDDQNKKWPSFFMGRGEAGGKFTYGKDKSTAKFTLDCPSMLQVEGLQHQRLLGELIKPGTSADGKPTAVIPTVKVRVTQMSGWEDTGDTYDHERFPVGKCTISGVLEFNGKSIPFNDALCRASFSYPHRDVTVKWTKPNFALPHASFKVLGKDLGLQGPLAEASITVSVAWEAVSAVAPGGPGKVPVKPPSLDGAAERGTDDLGK